MKKWGQLVIKFLSFLLAIELITNILILEEDYWHGISYS
jgi:hypothetical protein